MANITLKGTPIHTIGNLPAPGSKAPAFTLTGADLKDLTLADFAGKTKILNIVPSLDTGICQLSAKRFNGEVGKLQNVVLLNISADLPFAAARFCNAEKLGNVVVLSSMRAPEFGRDYGVVITDGPLKGLLSRAVVVLDTQDKVLHAQQVPEIAQEPDYEAVLKAVRG